MDAIFSMAAAENLLRAMDAYCSSLQKEARDVLSIMKQQDEWNDVQSRAFQNNLDELANDLNQSLSLQGEYMRTYQERIRELRG